ncbi:hypothetical protein ACWEPC_30585 [Nonomuraea sp. NPDC004297]
MDDRDQESREGHGVGTCRQAAGTGEGLELVGQSLHTDISTNVALTLADDFQDHTHLTPSAVPTKNVTAMLDELLAKTVQSKGAEQSL